MRDLLGVDVPVHSGADRPLVAPPHPPATSTARAGSTAPTCPPRPARSTAPTPSGSSSTRAGQAEGVWLVGVGPLTNLALALRAAPDLAGRIAGISMMGGGTFGNRTAVAEFNIWADPEAAAVVFGYGGPLVMAGLDLTHQLLATPTRIDAVRGQPGRLAARARRPVRLLLARRTSAATTTSPAPPSTTRAPCSP